MKRLSVCLNSSRALKPSARSLLWPSWLLQPDPLHLGFGSGFAERDSLELHRWERLRAAPTCRVLRGSEVLELSRSMAALLSAFPCLCNSPPLERLSAATSTSYGVLKRVGVSGKRISKPLVRAKVQKQEGGGGRGEAERDEVSDLENALGIENKTVRNVTADKNGPPRRKKSMLDAIEEQMRVNDENKPPENKWIQTIRVIGDWLIDKTENSGGQDNVVIFALAVFPFWALALLVTSGVITLPFDLPFLRDLPQHLAETQ